ncbi:hypothetical protein [Pediococcus acidilactici]|nr:hypothetical protein [Pediococcus acidilactici]
MSAQDKRDLTHATGVRQWIYDKTSVLDLPKGHYETLWSNLTDTPILANETMENAPYCEIDVESATTSKGTRKQFWFYASGTGKVWYRNIHSRVGNVPNAWEQLVKYTTLWSGSIHGEGTLTLVDDLKNYDALEFGYSVLGNVRYQKMRIANEMVLRDSNLPDDDNNMWTAFYETTLDKIDDTHLVIKHNKGILRGGTGDIAVDNNQIVIASVRGIR